MDKRTKINWIIISIQVLVLIIFILLMFIIE